MTATIDRPEYTRWDRFEQVEFLEETTNFTRHRLFNELLRYMSDEEFERFYEHFCSCWDICRDHQELQAKYPDNWNTNYPD